VLLFIGNIWKGGMPEREGRIGDTGTVNDDGGEKRQEVTRDIDDAVLQSWTSKVH
jgi:hypothetical protein